MRVVALVVTALGLGALVALRARRARRDHGVQMWAAATDALRGEPAGSVP